MTVQHFNKTANAPFRETSTLGKAWVLGIKGTSIKELTRLCTKEGADLTYLLRKLRSGVRYHWTWRVQEGEGKLKIYNAKRA